MRTQMQSLTAVIIGAMLLVARAEAIDQHSVEAIRDALQSPIPQATIEQARQLDGQILRTGVAMETKVYLVTDERQQRVQSLVTRLLTVAGDSPQDWVVRVFDSDPKQVNAFVNGGKYIYVFTGLLEQASNDSELAVVLGHEIGHSVLKHNTRRNQDITTTIAGIAALYGQLKGGRSGANAMAMSETLQNGYGRDDEREADAFGALVAGRASLDPMGGAGFFSRMERINNTAVTAQTKELDDYKEKALVVKSRCETWRAQWANGQIAQTPDNAALINQTCAQYEQARSAYNVAMAQQTANQTQLNSSDHPADNERIASFAAIADWLHGARPIDSLQEYPHAYNVVVALMQNKSPIFATSTQ